MDHFYFSSYYFSIFFKNMTGHSLLFCPACGSLLDAPTGSEDFVECHCCSHSVPASRFELLQVKTTSTAQQFPSRPTYAIKKQEQRLNNGATIQEDCPKCSATELVFHTAQLRGADEGQTVFYTCLKCGYKTKLNS